MRQSSSTSLLPFTTKALKYFFLGLAGCTVFYFVSVVLQLSTLSSLLVACLEHVFSRGFVLLVCLGAIAVITESIKS